MTMYTTLKKLLPQTPSVSGREHGIREVLKELMAPLCDEITVDAMGNLICLKKGSAAAPAKVMLAAHMDEIGFIVNFIDDNGFLRVAPIGGISYTAAAFCPVEFENGTRGVLAVDADKKAGDVLRPEHCYVDIGARSRAAAEKKVKIGDCCALLPSITRLQGGRVAGRPLDDRAGCAVLVEIARRMAAPADDIYYVFSVQEEVGCRGARPAAYSIAPDLALIFDVTATGDVPSAKPMAVKLGAGVAIKIKDSSVICHTELVEELIEAARAEKIAAQCEILTFGGTDTSAVQMTGFGCRAGALSIPCRYIHTGSEMIDLADLEAAVALAVAYLKGEKK
ncbi:MAG: M42 family metallopeptidase [Ruminococcaceae bacterium]|nr:M42 family metallopeptidase [Oscillospiraceae bacterium]